MSNLTPTDQVDKWLEKFKQLLIKNNTNAASRLFQDDCNWRDLVSLTWNIKTCEGCNQIADMLDSLLSNINLVNWKQNDQATKTETVIESWITFETSVARGCGQVRLIGGKCWTL